MNKILFIFLILVPYLNNAQTIERSDIIGEWIVIEGKTTKTELRPEVNQMMKMMIDGFEESIWTFASNGSFRINFKENLSPLMEEMKFLDEKLWKLNESKKQIRIGTKEDNYNHLVLLVKQFDSKIKVYFSDTPIYLILKKND